MAFDNEFDALVLGSGAKGFKFENVGDSVTGTIVDKKVRQRREYRPDGSDGPLKFWDEAKTRPVMQGILILQTALRDASLQGDDGKRSVYLLDRAQKALGQAVRSSTDERIELGAQVTITYRGPDPNSKGGTPAKLFDVKYVPAGHADFDSQVAPSQPAASPEPAAASTELPVPAEDLSKYMSLLEQGLTADQAKAFLELQKAGKV